MTHISLKAILSFAIAPIFMASCASASDDKAAVSIKAAPPLAASSAKTAAQAAPVIAPKAEDVVDDGEPRPYDATRDAHKDVDTTLFAAQVAEKNAIIVMGANWCHDSRALAGHFMTPRFERLFASNYEYVYVDMGVRNRNLDIAALFGVKKVEGTPTVIITDKNGKVLNGDTAKTWRDAASRSEDDIYEEFLSFAPNPEGL